MQCRDLIEREGWEVKISLCYREVNRVADKLANLGVEKEVGVVYFDSPPKEILDILNANVVGAT